MDSNQLQKLIDRYLAGKASSIEKQVVEQWLSNTENQPENLSENDRARIGAELLSVIAEKTGYNAPGRNLPLFGFGRPLRQIAAGIAIGLVILATYTLSRHYEKNKTRDNAGTKIQYLTYTALRGQKTRLIMPDNSEIWLNSNTVVRYPQRFSGNTREVYLDKGEAFFKVQHDTSKPFIVHTSHLDVQVLGTSFNVRSDQKIDITVSTGKVAVLKSGPKKPVLLKMLLPDEELLFSKLNAEYTSDKVKATDKIAWKENTILFKDAGYDELKQVLENWYDVEISFQGDVPSKCLFTARFQNKSLNDVLTSLKMINGFGYTLKGKKVVIQTHPCN